MPHPRDTQRGPSRDPSRDPSAVPDVGPVDDSPVVDAGDGGMFLATAVSYNAVFSALSGLVLLTGGAALSGWFGVETWLLPGIGGGLVLFAGALVWLLSDARRLAAGARWVVAADAAWVAAAVALLVGLPSALSAAGRIALAAVTVIVAVIAVGQIVGLRRHRSGPMTAAAPIDLGVERIVAAPAEQAWRAVADAGDYARFAPGIAATRVVDGAGEGMVRVCRDDHGGEWAETCTLWDEGHRYRMTVDVASYPVYYRMLLHEFAQTWTVEPAEDGSRISLAFEGSVKLGILGRLAARLLGNRRRLEAILDNYEHELAAERPAI